ncbi:uncharacterized protein LOC136065022 [Quercus suber]|uniref:uncharacterized protein LOC136065022 n=1 Tax=Quercus suber TaxID=58331 RepID=UPI0032DFA9C8
MKRCSYETSFGHYKCYLHRSRKDQVLPLQDNDDEDSNSEPKRAKVNARPALSFVEEDKVGTIQPHDDALVVMLRIGGYDVKRVMVDQGSGTKIMYPDMYKGLNLRPEDLTAYSSPLVSFDEKVVIPRGQIRLLIQTSSEVVEVDFIVVDAYSPYTAIKVKYLSGDQIEEIVGSQSVARQCLVAAIQHRPKAESSAHIEEGLLQLRASTLPIDGPTEKAKCEDLIGAQLPTLEKEGLLEFLRRNVDVFAWNDYEAPGVDPSFICHHLNVNPTFTPKKQPTRYLFRDHSEAIRDEVKKLKQAEAIKEVFYLEWLANIVVVKKKSGKWRVCVDFTDLNRACPKDPFPIPNID